jgi:DNA (cytosine-5)-methyltransferase 1
MVDKQSLNELALFAGAGGGILGGHLLGWKTVCAVEWEPYAACVLAARQNDGILPSFPIWDDVQTFKGEPWRGIVDVVSGGFPCTDISIAGNGAGIEGEQSGMWREMARIIGEVRPRYAFVENSPMLVTRGLERVLADLTSMGYDSRWGVISAADIGAKHKRERVWIVASSNSNKQYRRSKPQQPLNPSGEKVHNESSGICSEVPKQEYVGNTESPRLTPCAERQGQRQSWGASIGSSQWWETEPNVDRVVDGLASRVDRLKAIGNGQVPLCAATAWRILK